MTAFTFRFVRRARLQSGCLALMALVVAMTAAASAQTSSAAAALEAARKVEVIDGNLTAAIAQYQAIVERFTSDRAISAQALLRMAECYEKLGDARASDIYGQLARDFADLPEARGARTLQTPQLTPNGARRKLPGRVEQYLTISYDGRTVAYKAETGDLAVRDLTTGAVRRLTSKASFAESDDAAGESVFSRDGGQIAFNWWSHIGGTDKKGGYELRVVPAIGTGAIRTIVSNRPGMISPYDWSPDGRSILAVIHSPDNIKQIAIVRASDGSINVLKTLDWRAVYKPVFSPDGRYVAYPYPATTESPKRDIYVIATDGSRGSTVVEHSADDNLLGWAPDGSSLIFSSDRTGILDIWKIGVTDGKPQGEPTVLSRNAGSMNGLAITRDGSLYYRVPGIRELYVGTLDPAGLRRVGPAIPVTERFTGTNTGAVWSNDGTLLAFVSQRGPRAEVPTMICIRSADGKVREVAPTLQYINGYLGIRWFPHDEALLVVGADNVGRAGMFKVDIRTGQAALIARESPRGAELSPDGRTVFYHKAYPGLAGAWLVSRDIESGEERQLYDRSTQGGWDHLALAPDGRTLAFVTERKATTTSPHATTLVVVPADRPGTMREILTTTGDDWLYPPIALAWTSDGQRVMFGRTKGTSGSVWSMTSNGADLQSMGLDSTSLLGVRLHPHRTQIAYTADDHEPELWVMEKLAAGASTVR